MSKQIIKLPVDQLSIGTYVSRLDRPWEGTPFLFQGFTIESEDELAAIQRLCRSVYAEVAVADAEDSRTGAGKWNEHVDKAVAPDPLHDASVALKTGAAPAAVKDTAPLRVELAAIQESYADAKRTVSDVFENLHLGRNLDVTELGSVVDWMVDSVFRNRDAMGWLARMKSMDDYLYSHSISSSVWALALGRHMGLDKATLSTIGMGAMLLDIGKTKLPAELLGSPEKPTEQEWVILRGHVDVGVELAKKTNGIGAEILTMIATHHERFDGSGYPQKRAGEDIPLAGRIAGIVDCYDAMISKRRYAKTVSTFDAMRTLTKLGGSHFQTELVELFIQAVGVFPTGTLVELSTGEVGVVIAQNRFRRLRPEVMLILDARKELREEFAIVDLNTCEANDKPGRAGLWITRGLEPNAHGIDPTEYFL